MTDFDFDFAIVLRSLPQLWQGLQYTLQLTLVAAAGGIFFGTLLALARLGTGPLAWIAGLYVNVMRSIPLLLVIFWFYLMLPLVLQHIGGLADPPRITAGTSAYTTFIMFEAAYFCEIIRSGVNGISRGQASAAAALGMTPAQGMRLIVLPQAFRNVVPLLLTQTIVLFQDVSLVSLLNVTDLVGAAVKIAQRDGRIVEMYGAVAIAYLIVCVLLSLLVKRLNHRIAILR